MMKTNFTQYKQKPFLDNTNRSHFWTIQTEKFYLCNTNKKHLLDDENKFYTKQTETI